ncbi:MAG: ABC transporter permease [Clostridia bacterium]|nr:ABC transporter permease [Clostridia bacterium]
MLRRKFFRDIIKNKSQFITIFAMVFLGVFIYSGINSYMAGMQYVADRYYDENNFQDIWIIGTNFTKNDLNNIKNINNVRDAERKLSVIGSINNIKDSTIQINFIESNNISKFYVKNGIGFNRDIDGVWIDSYLANNNNLNVGDVITVKYGNETFDKKIVGLIIVPDHVYDPKSEAEIFPTHTDYGFIYLSDKQFPYKAEYMQYNSVMVDVENISATDETKVNIENKTSNWIAVTDRGDDVSSQTYKAEMEEGTTYVVVFSGIFLFIAILSVITTMNRFVKKQRTELGILKSLGFKNKKIMKLYLSYGFWISLFASILGLITGPMVIGKVFSNMVIKYFAIPELYTIITAETYFVSGIVVVVIALVTYLSCRKELKEKVVDVLREKSPKENKSNINFNNKIFKKIKFSTKWNIRDAIRGKARILMGIIGTTGCCALIICAFGMLNTINDYVNWQFNELYNFKYKMTLNRQYSEDNYNNIVSKYGNNTSQTLNVEIKNSESKEINNITVDNSNGLLKYTNINRKYIELNDDGVYITSKLAERLNLNVGDNINWHILGDETWYNSKIIGINRNPQNQNFSMTKKYLESLEINYRADSIYTNYDMSNIKELEGVDIIQNKDFIKNGTENMISTVKSMIIMIIVAAIILGAVIIYNLGILSFTEKSYQFATLKVLGFSTNKIRSIFIEQNFWVTLIAIILGGPLGYYITYVVFKMALSEDYDMIAKVDNISYLYGILGTLIVSYIVNNILSRKIKTVNMVESLKANE